VRERRERKKRERERLSCPMITMIHLLSLSIVPDNGLNPTPTVSVSGKRLCFKPSSYSICLWDQIMF
jgi:hypothetical protein